MSVFDIVAWVFIALGALLVAWGLVALAFGPAWARRPRPGAHAAPSGRINPGAVAAAGQAPAIRENTTRSSSRPCSLMNRSTIVVFCPRAAGVTSRATKP